MKRNDLIAYSRALICTSKLRGTNYDISGVIGEKNHSVWCVWFCDGIVRGKYM